jgi:dipeptidyl aminopeptidase/acylaminoacyl peptidase
MSDRFDVLERYASLFEAPEPSFDGLLRRRDRKRRNQRITAGVVGIAVFVAAVWLVTTGLPLDRSQTPATSGGTGLSVMVPDAPETDYVFDLDDGVMTPLPGSIIRSLGGSVLSGHYAVSADGTRLAYVGLGDDGNPQIFVARLDGTRVRQVTHEPTGATSPAWSPDGTMIAYVDGGSHPAVGDGNLFILDVSTGAVTPLDVFGSEPQFTPDGGSLVYTAPVENRGKVFTVPVAGGPRTVLLPHGRGITDAGFATLSPDGSLVTFVGDWIHGPGPRRWVADADGTDLRQIPWCDSFAAAGWSPDGSRIVCAEGNSIVVVDITTGNGSRVAEGRAAIWLDDSTLLVEV